MDPPHNTFKLPEHMKRPGVQPDPPRPENMRCVPACLLVLGLVFWMLLCVLFAFDTGSPRPDGYQSLVNLLAVGSAFGYLMAFLLSLVAVVMGWSRFRNAWVLVFCLLSPILCVVLLMSVMSLFGMHVL